ncbi:amino acid ABC transporter substrate-binding protein [Kineosporia sp. J2-2]|uniref:Amino acid ABC transporter substrate-binding protein n=1 Tax=Kineosporia corallincola TaxID=2835133 RepID=A0ABS5TB93_9ACTN|nr:ABC transporter substrate-binding protein [Kineosporia corallincola]MBT0768306.1 amino acid ABC transporter substrate-binding protein [Kineosporia corallincola]
MSHWTALEQADTEGLFQLPSGRRRRVVVLLLVAALVLALGGWGIATVVRACGGLGSGVTSVGGECVGVSDSFVFDEDEYAGVMSRITAENASIGQGSAVTVAVLGSFTTDDTSAVSKAEMRRQLAGAYVAQRRHNTSGTGVRMKLVVANWGSHEQEWSRVVDGLVERVDDEDPLVAVTGMGVSVTQTRDAARRLSQAGIPMVGTITTADELTAVDGYFRVSPPNREYVSSLRSYVQRTKGLKRAVLMADQGPASNDLFTANLAEDMRTAFAREIGLTPIIQFTGTQDPQGVQPNSFAVKAVEACRDDNDLLLYAGRSNDLAQLLNILVERCGHRKLTVMTGGSDDLGRFRDLSADLAAANITLVYASGADAVGWLAGQDTPAAFGDFHKYFADAGLGDDTELDDGAVMSAHDSVRVVSTALELALEEGVTPGENTRHDVMQAMSSLNGDFEVQGATGDFSFQVRPPATGDPVGKPVPVVSIPQARQQGPTYRTEPGLIRR